MAHGRSGYGRRKTWWLAGVGVSAAILSIPLWRDEPAAAPGAVVIVGGGDRTALPAASGATPRGVAPPDAATAAADDGGELRPLLDGSLDLARDHARLVTEARDGRWATQTERGLTDAMARQLGRTGLTEAPDIACAASICRVSARLRASTAQDVALVRNLLQGGDATANATALNLTANGLAIGADAHGAQRLLVFYDRALESGDTSPTG